MSIPWPEDLCSGTATWWLGYIAADAWVDDDRKPQLISGGGIRVTFSPDVSQAVRYDGVEGLKTLMPLISSGVIDDDGYLCTEKEDGSAGERGVVLPSSECETLTPRDWTWTVTVTENRMRVNRFSISLSPGETVDLAEYVEVSSSGGTHIVTEKETAERAVKARDDAETFRNQTRTDRVAAQAARTGAETAETNAQQHATASAASASSAAEILEATQDLGITVDTSVGTRVFVGDTMIHGDTGWFDVSDRLLADVATGGFAQIRRVHDRVTVKLDDITLRPGTGWIKFFDVPWAFQAAIRDERIVTGVTLRQNASLGQMLATFGDTLAWIFEMSVPNTSDRRPSGGLTGHITWITSRPWPTSFPDTPA